MNNKSNDVQWKSACRRRRSFWREKKKRSHISLADTSDEKSFPHGMSFALFDLFVGFSEIEVLHFRLTLFVQTEGEKNDCQE